MIWLLNVMYTATPKIYTSCLPLSLQDVLPISWCSDIRPQTCWADTGIYERHVKGMTATRSDLPAPLRGSFAGLADPRVIDHLVRLGVTALELMPVQAFIDDRHLVQKGLSNYWGYNTIGFFAPATRYI